MTRTFETIERKFNQEQFPPPGRYPCRCIDVENWISPKKGTPALKLHWQTLDDTYRFSDLVFVTPKALRRLVLVARHICDISDQFELSDDDTEASKHLARYIRENIRSRKAFVTIEEEERIFIYEQGPKIGEKGVQRIRRVVFDGYDSMNESSAVAEPESRKDDEEDALPF